VRQHQSEGSTRQLPDNARALAHVEATPRTGGYLDKRVRYVFLNSVEYLGEIFAAAYRSAGYDAHVAAPLDAAASPAGGATARARSATATSSSGAASASSWRSTPPTSPRA
jgi:hypothetical protein